MKERFECFHITRERFLKPDPQDIIEAALEIFRIEKPVPIRRLDVPNALHRLFPSCASRWIAGRERERQSIGCFKSSKRHGFGWLPWIPYSWLSLTLSAVKAADKPG